MKSKLLPLITICFILFLSWTNVKAQADSIKLAQSRLAKAEQLINATGMSDNRFVQMRSVMIKSMSSTIHIPEKNQQKFTDEMTSFMNKYMPLESFKSQFVKIYAETFTEDELKQMIDFYSSPVGKKVVEKLPALTQKAMSLSQLALKDHFDEMQSIVAQYMNE
jgi:hypothetical protein